MCICTHVEKEFAIKIIDASLFTNLDLSIKSSELLCYLTDPFLHNYSSEK